jgi:uncharacterized membrane protein YccC
MDDDAVRRTQATQAKSEHLLIDGERLRARSQALHQRSQELMERSRALLERFALDQAPHDRPAPAEDQGGAEHR